MCILLNVKKHEKTFALNVDIFTENEERRLTATKTDIIMKMSRV